MNKEIGGLIPHQDQEQKKLWERLKIPEGASYRIFLGLEEKLLGPSPGFKYFPDGRISVEEAAGKLNACMAAERSSFCLEGPSIRLLRVALDKDGVAIPVLSPEPNSEVGPNYVGFYSMLKVPTLPENERLGFVHGEYHPNGNGEPFKGTIGIVKSFDNGKTWDQKGMVVIIKGQKEYNRESEDKVSGVGEPCAIIINDRVHLYYVDWTNGFDGIQLATASIYDDLMKPESWKPYPMTVVDPPWPREKNVWAAMPVVSYNKALEKYLMLLETSTGIFYCDSHDGFNWGESKLLFKFTKPITEKEKGEGGYRYHTLYSPGEETNLTTTDKGWLLISKGTKDEPHYLVGYPYQIGIIRN